MQAHRVTVGIVGAGYWGRNHVRTFASLSGADLRWVCDLDAGRLDATRGIAPSAGRTREIADLLRDPDLSAVVIATPSSLHAGMARSCLEAGKHVLVEKPMALGVEDAEALDALSRDRGLVLMVGHLLVYHPAVTMLRGMVERGDLGKVHYLYSQRVNLGTARSDENALWSFGPHDLSIIHEIFPRVSPVSVSARGSSYLQPGIEDVVFMNVLFDDGMMAHVQLSWLDPHRERRMTIVGSRKMVTFDDVSASEKVRVHDKGFDRPPEYGTFGEFLTLRDGDVWIPKVPFAEPLRLEAEHFVECVAAGRRPRTDGGEGLWTVRILVAAQRSMERGGSPEEPA